MPRRPTSEFRLYEYIPARLRESGWSTKMPPNGDVYTQNEVSHNALLKQALGKGRPEYTVVIRENCFWVIEAKANLCDLQKAVEEAKKRAQLINAVKKNSCQIITGVAGDVNSTHCVQTHCFVNNSWKELLINKRPATGFISREQVKLVLSQGGALDDYDIDDNLFHTKISEINHILHNGAIHKRGRAEVLACLLLALANDPQMTVSANPGILINDINTRAESELRKHGKDRFFAEIKINPPSSQDNHRKNQMALAQSIEKLRELNITSAISSGRDVLGQCYEQFLKYANDAKEIGIVLTPRNIANFATNAIDVRRNDVVFDPTCGTGGFLVAALDKVRKDGGDINEFKKGNLHGVEQDPLIATLAIINMVFRGDGSSKIKEGNSLNTEPPKCDKVLMNPPFALAYEYEWQFVDQALKGLREGGLLFAILPAVVVCGTDNKRKEMYWRTMLVKNHTIKAVITLPPDLFYPQVSKGTYGLIICAHRPHNFGNDRVLWAILHDGVKRTKTKSAPKNNMSKIEKAVGNFIATDTLPAYVEKEIDCSLINPEHLLLSPESNIGKQSKVARFNTATVKDSVNSGQQLINREQKSPIANKCAQKLLISFFQEIERGKSGRKKSLPKGNFPLISTSERNNGISAMVKREETKKTYPAGCITVSANGGSCYAHYHPYEFAANSDVFVCFPKKEFSSKNFCVFLCSAINAESWRYNYYRKFTSTELEKLHIFIPTFSNGEVDYEKIKDIAKQ